MTEDHRQDIIEFLERYGNEPLWLEVIGRGEGLDGVKIPPMLSGMLLMIVKQNMRMAERLGEMYYGDDGDETEQEDG